MKIKQTCAAFMSGVMAFGVLSGSLPSAADKQEEITASAASVCQIDIDTEYQVIRGFGGMNHPEWTGKDLTAEQRQTAFGNGDNELGLTVLRVFVNPDSTQWNKAVPTAQFASKMGATVFASPWEPPSSMAESGGSNGKLHLPKSNYGAYAKHLNDFGTYMKNNGVDLYAISVQNEPDFASEWTYWSTDETTDFIANYGDQITSTRLMSPESFQYSPEGASWIANGDGGKTYYKKILNSSKAFANCDVFGTHFYGTQRAWMDYPELENCGKEIWMTEVYTDSKNDANVWPLALDVSENIHNGLVVSNLSAYTWWYIRRSYGLMTEDGKISKRGYCMAQYSKYVRPGDIRVAATEQPASNVYISSYKNDENQVTIVAINKSDTEYNQVFDIGQNITDVDRYRTSANESLAPTLIAIHKNVQTLDMGSIIE
ncbi:MAG: glucuronoarabinoxylan endo-1,4-beta-xylanase, partial [Ruminococcus sp.]